MVTLQREASCSLFKRLKCSLRVQYPFQVAMPNPCKVGNILICLNRNRLSGQQQAHRPAESKGW